jgi:hypothetical protein
MIVQSLLESSETLQVMTLAPQVEQLLHNVLQQGAPGVPPVLEPGMSENLFNALRDSARKVEDSGVAAVLVVAPSIRPWLSQAVRQAALWHESGREVPIAVNVSALQFQQAQFSKMLQQAAAPTNGNGQSKPPAPAAPPVHGGRPPAAGGGSERVMPKSSFDPDWAKQLIPD